MTIFQKFENIPLRKTLLDFNLTLKKQVVMSNSNTFQPNVNTLDLKVIQGLNFKLGITLRVSSEF